MDEFFSIFVDRLRSGREEVIQEVFSPDFLDTNDPDMVFQKEVRVAGKAYIASDELVIHFDIEAEVFVPCAICNEPTSVPLRLQKLIHVVPLEEIAGGIYSFQPFLRDTILLEVPFIVECHGGNCPSREEMKLFYHQPKEEEEEGAYRPFSDLSFDEE